jgi:hypothetical protein
MREPIRIYQAENGIWRIEMRDDKTGELRWSSLRTRDEKTAAKEFTRRLAVSRALKEKP